MQKYDTNQGGSPIFSQGALGQSASKLHAQELYRGEEVAQPPLLAQIIGRLENLACRLGDVNIGNRLFIERIVGGRPEPVKDNAPTGQSSLIGPAIIDLLNLLDRRVCEAEQNARELTRIS